ncbi:anaerobic ribonucleoside-triphosphate reductase activating protein [Pararhodospirillum oryzae]|uniref:Anaerobic ribonucleoside-triphosphate reductase activating protein n=1 Tax=Pararhodospirillum oryzae TaxID=478448 RepID=A0A512H930_9PROT|nr:anaerobic ribonucleoside-triphosphate reductase activating protein [Pararhodospirillum oryzae]GEO81966.1 anaerobic ribonucleoside-triphosphate reductase activating protein [Pararhodospirillum oryzae]
MSDFLRVGGLARLSTCDWPGQLVATVFCQGCPWRCAYCHNPHLWPAGTPALVSWDEVLAFLDTRRGLLDGVVFSGGEALWQPGLPEAMAAVRALGFRVGLHTGGAFPRRLAAVLPLLDWIGFDVKAPFAAYDALTRMPGSGARARESLRQVLAAGVPVDVRTTVHPALLDEAGLRALDADLAALGAPPIRHQPFRPAGCADPVLVGRG